MKDPLNTTALNSTGRSVHLLTLAALALGTATLLSGCNSGSRSQAKSTTAGATSASATGLGSGTASTGSATTPAASVVLLDVVYAGTGTGTIAVEPQSPTGTYPSGTIVTLRALPDVTSGFRDWGGDLPGVAQHELVVTLTQDLKLEPVFDLPAASGLIADFQVGPDPASGVGPLTISFTNQSQGSPARVEWDFGDGNTSADDSPTHTYQNLGTYTVTLRVYDAQNAQGKEDVRFNTVTVVDASSGSRFWYAGNAYGGGPKTNDAADTTWAQQVLSLVNAERAKVGLAPLAHDLQAEHAAKAHSDDMVGRNFFGHITSEGWGPNERLNAVGAQGVAKATENIAQAADPGRAMQLWLNSAGHRANLLDPDVTHLGVGIAHPQGGSPVWTQVFLRR